MQKKLIALAIAAAFAPAVAMADTSNVTVYGIADASFDNVKNGGTTSVTNNKISSNASRLGLKGAEDLGGGLKAIWQIEQQINIDGRANGAATADSLATRNTFVGLAGDSWGSLTLGRNDTPYKTSTRAMDMFADHIADNRSLMGMGRTGFDVRFTDTVRYDSPSFSGFKVAGSYTASAEGNTTSAADVKGKAVSLSGNYETGPFSAALAYQKNTFGSNAGAVVAAAPGLNDEKAWKAGVGYKVAQFAVNGVYEKTTDTLGSTVGATAATTGRGHKAYYLSGAFNATANDAIKLAYTKVKNLADGNAPDAGAKQWALGVDHSMSKRTTVYAMYTKLDNDLNSQFNLSSIGVTSGFAVTPAASADPSAFSFGMKHVF